MENASKALIIAGAILLAILLISLGIMIFNQAQDTVNNSGMSQAEITAYNNKLLKYEGDNQPGSVVKSLYNEVNASNQEQSQTSSGRSIAIYSGERPQGGGSGGTKGTELKSSDIKTNLTYKVEMVYNGGVITEIYCKANTTKTTP